MKSGDPQNTSSEEVKIHHKSYVETDNDLHCQYIQQLRYVL